MMKCIDAIIKPSKVEAVKKLVRQVGVKAMTLSDVKDCAFTDGKQRIYRGSSFVIDSVPMVRVQIIVDEEMVKPAVDAIVSTARRGEIGNGNIFVYPVAEAICIRVDESQYGAIGDRDYDSAKVA
jgi:nitrogen regulatory protein P-II 1